MGTMMRDFHFSEEAALWDLPLVRAFAYRAWATESQPWAAVERMTEGYIAQEGNKS